MGTKYLNATNPKMSVGDLVRWTHPSFESWGIVIEIMHTGDVNICWAADDDTDGIYPVNHRWLELANPHESR